MQIPPGTSENKPAPVFPLDALRTFHQGLPLAGDPPDALLSLPDDQLSYLIAAIRNTPRSPPDLSLDDWHTFLALLQPHGIYPLMAFHLRTWPEDCRPPREIMEYLNRLFLLAAARSLRAGRQIQAVTDALKDAGIPVILMKGPALARTVYPDPALRQSSDIDLLVQPRNLPAAEEVLEKMGYTCPEKLFHISQFAYNNETFSSTVWGLNIELHWIVDNGYNLFPEGWLDDAFLRRVTIRSNDLTCDTLSQFDHLQILVFHDVFHIGSMRLDWVYDISLMMGMINGKNTWKEIGQQSVEHHVRIPMELALTSASLWTGCEYPWMADDFSSWPAPSDREVRLLNYFTTRSTNLFSYVYLVMQGQPGLFEKLRFVWQFIFPPVSLLAAYRMSSSPLDIPVAHLRRWVSILNYR